MPCAARAQQSKRQSASQRLRSKDKARYNRWKQTDGGKQENNDTMSASMTGSQLSTPVELSAGIAAKRGQWHGEGLEGVCLHTGTEVAQQDGGCTPAGRLHTSREDAHQQGCCTPAQRLHISTEVVPAGSGERKKKNLAS